MRPLAFARLEVTLSELVMLHAWLAWSGLGAIVVGMRRHGYELRLDSDHEGWKASFLHPLAHLPPVGWPSAHVVADAVESGACAATPISSPSGPSSDRRLGLVPSPRAPWETDSPWAVNPDRSKLSCMRSSVARPLRIGHRY